MATNNLIADVRRLFDSIGVPQLGYRELGSRAQREDAVARWPLLGLARSRVDGAQEITPTIPSIRMDAPNSRCVVAVVSVSGGSGRTTVAANLAHSLAVTGRRMLAMDLDPQNQLALHFGVDPDTRIGMGHANVSVRDVTSFVERQMGAAVLPFGTLAEATLAEMESRLQEDDNWLRLRLEAFAPSDAEFVLLDVPAGRGPWMRQALAVADQVVVVLSPTPAAYASVPATELLLAEALGPKAAASAVYLVNGFDGRSVLQRDLVAGLRAALGERVLPMTIQRDESVPEALMQRRSILQHASDSQVTADYNQLGEWLLGRWAAAAATAQAETAERLAG